ncbi:MAG: SpoIIE family protein phosphatase [Candidatus Zixiibacteriota bacterium]
MSENVRHTHTEKLLLKAASQFNSTLEYEELIALVLRLVMDAVGAEAAMIFRIDHRRTDMRIRSMRRGDDKPMIIHRELGQGVVGWVARYREPVIVNNAADDPRTDDVVEEQMGIDIRTLVTVPLIGKGQMIGVIEAVNKMNGGFSGTDMDVLTGLGNQIAVAIDNANLYRMARREALEKHLLYEIGMKLSGRLQLDEVLSEIMHSLKQAVAYDAGGVFLISPDNSEIGSIYTAGYDPNLKADLQLKIGQGLIGNVARSGETVVVADVTSDHRYVNARRSTRSELVAPMQLDGRIIGVFNLESDELNAYDSSDAALIEAFASQAAISIERAHLHQQILSGEKLQQQLSVAREIQSSFLPLDDPTIDGYDVSGRNIPSGEVGGDYYDFIEIVGGQTGIAVGDVSGKGVAAALIMASFRASLIAEIRNNYSIRTICSKVNDLVYESVSPGSFVTAVYGVLDSKNNIFTFANCGHNLPVLLRASGDVFFLEEGGQLLGVVPGAAYEERPIFLDVGDIICIYTDGVTEVFDEDGNEFGCERLVDLLRANRQKSTKEMQETILASIRQFATPDHAFDDITTVILKRID